MKNSIINSRGLAWLGQGRLAVLILNGALLLQSIGAGPPKTSECFQLDFPAKPAGLTNRPTISQPEIELSSALAAQLGESAVPNQLVPLIAHLLDISDRFSLTHGKPAHCRCIVRLTGLSIRKVACKSKLNLGQAVQMFRPLLGGKDEGITSQLLDLSTNVDWSSDKVQLSVRCAVLVEIFDTKSEVVLAQDSGEETSTNTAKAISLALGAVVYGKEDGQNGNNDRNASIAGADYQGRLIQLASYRAICKLLPKLDKRLLELAEPPASENGLNEAGATASTPSAGRSFCAKCGGATSLGDKFCTSCGARLSR